MYSLIPEHFRQNSDIDPVQRKATPEELFESHRWMVYRLWNLYFQSFQHIKEDLIQGGFLALWNTALQYDATVGGFVNYALPSIRRRMQRGANRQCASTCIPGNKLIKLHQFERFEHYFRGRHQRTPTTCDIAVFFDVTPSEVEHLQMLKSAQYTDSLDKSIFEGDFIGYCDAASDDRYMPSTARLEAEQLLEKIKSVIVGTVPGDTTRNLGIFRLRLGIENDREPMTLVEIGKVWGISRERVRQIEKPCLGFKILAAGRLCWNRFSIERAFASAFSKMKPTDGVIVGM